ncbi:hypothetical protein Asphe3_05120 [Pseudarthrobacter phenanthrenivorans Sphe3]|uniref:DNA/RNA endonuclease G n=1 Tax=Pseudarthrobacter phenanthrenivorans (strain DSM 18606 / JCM 16027 / LMG 23796 / Sphe3) TaxID=930171 RepID=F0MAB1_PSEPM|nr:hypothetical protein [Pseudarthrobacter phenanthrenivorans]ADX71724.1 hypothetical protein Asphe3_05120 [Pseudarthrobacter phenanthrenivorans Sphe3]
MSRTDQSGSAEGTASSATALHRRGNQGPDMQRILHRETHSTRAVVATVAAVMVMALAAYGLLEAAVHAIGQPAWLIEPQVAAERIVALPSGIPLLLLGAIGAVLAMVGLVFFLNGVLPGRRARHLLSVNALDARGPAVVVDDEVVASSLARRARLAANVAPEQVMVVVSQRQVTVNVRPTSGVPVDEEGVLAAVRDELNAMALEPSPEPRINVAPSGVIGA